MLFSIKLTVGKRAHIFYGRAAASSTNKTHKSQKPAGDMKLCRPPRSDIISYPHSAGVPMKWGKEFAQGTQGFCR